MSAILGVNDLICFSHLRWNFVYQRPQHIMSRFGKYGRVFFVEEPVYDSSTPHYTIEQQANTQVWVVTPHLPENIDIIEAQKGLLKKLMKAMQIRQYFTWYYSPMALSFSDELRPSLVIYDCMDELSAFRFAPAALKQYEAMLFDKADIVFTGGHHLYEAKQYLHHSIYPFPSSIDKDHFLQARLGLPEPEDQREIPRVRIGFYGVVDERFNVTLLKGLSTLHPDWHFVIVGPVVKIDPQSLPVLPNTHFLGGKTYNELPIYLSGWDVAMMPFALNESTKYISPTKTPEYLAGGKPVVSTSIRDVVVPYGKQGLVQIADTVKGFSNAIHLALEQKNNPSWLAKVDAFLAGNSWDKTFQRMAGLIENSIKVKRDNKDGNKREAYV